MLILQRVVIPVEIGVRKLCKELIKLGFGSILSRRKSGNGRKKDGVLWEKGGITGRYAYPISFKEI